MATQQHGGAYADPELEGSAIHRDQLITSLRERNPDLAQKNIRISGYSDPVDGEWDLSGPRPLRLYSVHFMVSDPLAESDMRAWWDQLSGDDQERLKQALQQYPAEPAIVDLLVSAGEPMSTTWTATSIADRPQAIAIHDPLKSFLENKIDDEE
ncbi:hypothetical protein [Mycobacterium sp. shizuoka-1]|uniref:hypothetical protein n=1 Tax=Mycobacterium sp. shizuoka-1 TaxID=2039281 RepID=UPI0011589D07|nr:hypothetical protein [Mycobacterium sp. shizuoka-1]